MWQGNHVTAMTQGLRQQTDSQLQRRKDGENVLCNNDLYEANH